MLRLFSLQRCRFLFPAYEDKVINYTQPVLLAEVAIMLWLTIMGAKEGRILWRPDQDRFPAHAVNFT